MVIKVALLALALILALIGWWKTGFRCPTYIHAIAGMSTALGLFVANNINPTTEVNQWWLLGKWWVVPMFPAIVYCGFAFYGGGIYLKKD